MTAAPELLPALEQTLEQLLQSLIEMGICASDVQESALEDHPGGAAYGEPAGLMGRKVAQTVQHLATLQSLKDSVSNVYIPLEVIKYVDAGKNPHTYTREFVERVAGENMYTHGIRSALSDYNDVLTEQMALAFPDLAELIPPATRATPDAHAGTNGNGNGHATPVKMEE